MLRVIQSRINAKRRLAISELWRITGRGVFDWLAMQAGCSTPHDEPLKPLRCPSCGHASSSFIGAGIATVDDQGDTTIAMVDDTGKQHRVAGFMLVVAQGSDGLVAYPQGRPTVFQIAECDRCGSTYGYHLAHELGRLGVRSTLCVDLGSVDALEEIPAHKEAI